jgi:hypothetical protein
MRRVPGLAEVACRARQEADKWLERAMPPAPPPARPVDRPAFFAGALEAGTPGLVSARLPEHVDDLAARAQRAAAGRFDLLGYTDLSFGRPLDWQWDVVADRRTPVAHWSRLDPLDETVVGDHKVPWELSRLQWLVTLAQAWRVTGDERLATRALQAYDEWETANPHGMGLNWASSLEVAIRLMSWCWMLALLGGSRELTDRWRSRLARSIASHAAHVERYLSYYFSPNTHLTGEALGLLYAAAMVDCRQSARWRALGISILETEADRQILPDGVYVEQATAYHRYTAEIYLQFLLLTSAAGHQVPSRVVTRVARLIDALITLCRPDGSMPGIGDADGGTLLPQARRAPDDCRGVFSVAAAVFGRSDYTWAAGGLAPETVWLLGADGAERIAALTARPPDRRPSTLLPDGGYVVMRESWARDAHQLVFDVGPLGCPASGAHGHADLLSVQASPFGEPCLVDPGTGEYTDLRGWRSSFRRTAAHSTVRVDGLDQAVAAGPFSWRGTRPAATLDTWRSGDDGDYADGRHQAFRTETGVVVHRRRVRSLPGVGWVVVDELAGIGRHEVEVRWQFAPIDVRASGPALIATLGSGKALTLVPVAAHHWYVRVARGGTLPPEGWYSPAYGIRVPAPQAIYSESIVLPAQFATLLLASEAPPAEAPPVEAAFDLQGRVTTMRLAAPAVEIAVTDEEIRVCAG